MSEIKSGQLEQLLRRGDVWRGHSRHFSGQPSWDSGHAALNQALLNQGWPRHQLTEVCQPQHPYCEWFLWGPTIAHNMHQQGLTVLLNPPSTPLLSGLAQQGIQADLLWLLQSSDKHTFLPCLSELLKASCVSLVLAWEPQMALTYTELRKIQLASHEHPGVCCLFRHERQRHHNSPAALRLHLQLQPRHLNVSIFKQKGKHHNASLQLALPPAWHAHPESVQSLHRSKAKGLVVPLTSLHRDHQSP